MHTLEAVMAALIMIGVIVFAVEATSLTPLTSSTANAHIEAQMQTMGQDMLNALSYEGYDHDSALKKDVKNWDGTEFVWEGSSYVSRDSSNLTLTNSSLADILNFIATPRGIAHNVHFTWIDDNGLTASRPYIYNGDPSDNAVIISKKVYLSNYDVGSNSTFYINTGIPDVDNSSNFYNIVNVKMTLWRM
ncbi:hypothetical protein SAMN04488589_2627 [Methanolobus vulcani]|jgi:hypothetical protein|uniref:Uncharacterized protein n=1 Tax=Methanolobus vulcani TaxID=38026 RepID=A0A7Z7AYS7_9EURY|nr:hypothetical protein [Methanolobus vulcani]MDK2826358.1 hypothetical protein [Methanolobus sp.]MDK2948127.1 hypothetical protein [Methanolobus sp.]SDG29639.1 hypothetical protein SAMN04488589_2627 [Methanolobus vulcani]